MIRINYLNRETLITTDEVVFHSPADEKVDERTFLQNIIPAEERFLPNCLGDDLYEDFMSRKNIKVTAENKAVLLEQINSHFENEGMTLIKLSDLKIGMIINSIEFVSDEWYVKLWDRYLWKLTAECVEFMAIVPSWLRTTEQGQQMNNPNNINSNSSSATGTAKDIQLKMSNHLQERIQPLIERMKLWICRNKQHFPLYGHDCGGCGCDDRNSRPDGVSMKTNFITGIYDD